MVIVLFIDFLSNFYCSYFFKKLISSFYYLYHLACGRTKMVQAITYYSSKFCYSDCDCSETFWRRGKFKTNVFCSVTYIRLSERFKNMVKESHIWNWL